VPSWCCILPASRLSGPSVCSAICLLSRDFVPVINAAKQVGPALFFSLLIIVVSFLPVFLLEAQEGRMFRPLAWTKTLAVGSSSILAITLVPVLMVMLSSSRRTTRTSAYVAPLAEAVSRARSVRFRMSGAA